MVANAYQGTTYYSFLFLISFLMVVKKTVSTASNAKKSAASRKSASPVAVPTPSRAVTQTTKPKVVIQTKQLGEREAPMYAQASCCGTGHRK
ncbi:MAG: hypothetical protein LBP53_03950 [Candidatus Peribacteria bacterium]|nr:hypothetical protein [Candidatus Peribacteria bacterium]